MTRTLREYIILLEKTITVNNVKIYVNPTRSDLNAIFNNSYLIKNYSKIPKHYRNIMQRAGVNEVTPEGEKYLKKYHNMSIRNYHSWVHDIYSKYFPGSQIDGEYPLRGDVDSKNNIYVVDSYDAAHTQLCRYLKSYYPDMDINEGFPFVVQMNKSISVPPENLSIATTLFRKYKMPINSRGYD